MVPRASWRRFAVMFVGLAVAVRAEAQGPTMAALRQGVSRVVPAEAASRSTARSGDAGGRVRPAVLGWGVGVFAGSALAVALIPPGPCGDNPGLCEALPGAIVGSVVLAGVGAALPKGRSACTFGPRALRGVVGAALGFGVGVAAGVGTVRATRTGDALFGGFFGGTLGTVIGSTMGASRCGASPARSAAAGRISQPRGGQSGRANASVTLLVRGGVSEAY